MDFMHKTMYKELLPGKKDYMYHPFSSVRKFIEVYQMHMAQQSEEASERRLKKFADVEKRRQFRLQLIKDAEERGEVYEEDPRYYVDETGTRRRRVKRWFGIWE